MNVDGEGALEVLLLQMVCLSCGRRRAFGALGSGRAVAGGVGSRAAVLTPARPFSSWAREACGAWCEGAGERRESPTGARGGGRQGLPRLKFFVAGSQCPR